jgi:NADPH-dependent ferric siderophore reductase
VGPGPDRSGARRGATTGVGDEYLRVMLPPPGEDGPVLPLVENGTLDYGTADMSRLRTYTVRAFDPGATDVTIDFVLHQHGAATTWSRSAKPGNVVGLNTPTGMYDAPAILRWQILVADRAGLPALARILDETPPTVRTRVVVEVPDAAHQLPLSHHHADITWVHGGHGHRPSRIEEIVRSMPGPRGTSDRKRTVSGRALSAECR